MTYRVFYTDSRSTDDSYEPNYSTLIPFEFDSKDISITKALELIENGAIVWRIEGSNDFLMGRNEIENEYLQRTGKRPKPQAK